MASISGSADKVVVTQASKSSIDITTYANELEAATALIYKYAAAWPAFHGNETMEERLNAISLAVAKTLANFCEDYEVLRGGLIAHG